MVYKVVEVDGVPVAKRSSSKQSVGGAKRALRTYRSSGVAVEEVVYPFAADAPDTGQLTTRELTIPLMRDGHIVEDLPDLEASRTYLNEARKTLPWEGLALSRDDAAVPTRMVGFKD
jgi:nicotinate phosphoribosyltransferase